MLHVVYLFIITFAMNVQATMVIKKTGCYAESNNRYDIISFYMICVANVHLYH